MAVYSVHQLKAVELDSKELPVGGLQLTESIHIRGCDMKRSGHPLHI